MSLLGMAAIQQRLAKGAYTLSDHALKRLIERNISESMIIEAGGQGESDHDL